MFHNRNAPTADHFSLPFPCLAPRFSVGSEPDDNDALAAAVEVPGRAPIRFAGEATHGEYMGSVHAALLSGIRVADEALGMQVASTGSSWATAASIEKQ